MNDKYYCGEFHAIIKSFDGVDKQAKGIEQYLHWINGADDASMTSNLIAAYLVERWYESPRLIMSKRPMRPGCDDKLLDHP